MGPHFHFGALLLGLGALFSDVGSSKHRGQRRGIGTKSRDRKRAERQQRKQGQRTSRS